jgi:hypothetical protein
MTKVMDFLRVIVVLFFSASTKGMDNDDDHVLYGNDGLDWPWGLTNDRKN